jgi:hypothetical protein
MKFAVSMRYLIRKVRPVDLLNDPCPGPVQKDSKFVRARGLFGLSAKPSSPNHLPIS